VFDEMFYWMVGPAVRVEVEAAEQLDLESHLILNPR
jgi:hypothetical protein